MKLAAVLGIWGSRGQAMEELCILCEVWQGRPFVCELPCTDTTGPMLTNSHSLTVTLQIWKACGPSTGTDILLGTVPLTDWGMEGSEDHRNRYLLHTASSGLRYNQVDTAQC